VKPGLVLAVALATSIGTGASLHAAEAITLRASDGTTLSAQWHAPARAAPAVLLVHMLTRTHAEWDLAAQALHVSGFGVMALDLRGHGASEGSASALGPMLLDVQAALDWLKTRPDVQSGRLGIAGASLGATLAVMAAAADPAVQSIALLSPASEYRGLRCEAQMRRYAERSGAVMLVASTGDPYALRTANHFEAMGAGQRDLRVVDATNAHGTTLLAVRPDLVSSLVDWFRRSLL
jgi:alpha-beta hydrolase superfamily lysophospholipase